MRDPLPEQPWPISPTLNTFNPGFCWRDAGFLGLTRLKLRLPLPLLSGRDAVLSGSHRFDDLEILKVHLS